MIDESARSRNQLLGLMADEQASSLLRNAQRVTVPLGEVICEPDKPIRAVHFPISSVVTSVVVLRDGAAVEAAVIGNEGMAGAELLVDERASPHRLIQQIEGESIRVPAEDFRRVVDESLDVRRLIERYLLVLLRQSGQNTACGRHHAVEARMCRWLLTTADRVEGNQFYITQEFLSEMLGVRRQSVNLTAGQLQQAGLIAYRRGRLTLLDRTGLEAIACECYQIVRQAYERLMGLPTQGGVFS